MVIIFLGIIGNGCYKDIDYFWLNFDVGMCLESFILFFKLIY